MLAVSIIVLSVNCGHYSLFSDYPIPSLLLLLLLMQLRTEKVADCCAVAVLTWFSEIATSLRVAPSKPLSGPQQRSCHFLANSLRPLPLHLLHLF